MNGPAHRLSRDELQALKFAAHRQLARWAKRRPLRSRQQAQRSNLVRAVRVLEAEEFADGCELHGAMREPLQVRPIVQQAALMRRDVSAA
jgi:hypothetical protein